MTPQEIFDTAVSGVIAQGRPGMDKLNCKYRGEGGLKCAVGFLLEDEIAIKLDSCEMPSVCDWTHGMFEEVPPYFWENRELLGALQKAHDDNWPSHSFVKDFKNSAREVAVSFGLSPIALE